MLACAALSVPALAQQGMQPGEYLDSNGGFLLIKPAKGGGTPFEIQTIGPNKHTCQVDGVIGKDGRAVLKQDGETCRVVFTPKAEGIEVMPNDQCRSYCGVRASFDGLYLKPEKGCERTAVRKTRADFKRLYDKKAYNDALAALEPILKRCTKTLDLDSDGWIRNDLALTLYHLGDSTGCRNLLEPLAKDAAKTEATIREELPPSDGDSAVRLARATRTNLKLCQGTKKP